ncbi:hypothetical protein BB561_002748 [Smittium simulii]|uniref:UNC-45/Cro1/She4 central domain-containing protein n=1 Tax=Smittium simulii TaxID=133385 RepID=A0A2T9YPJ9_9FUNG|nr:hypothetical protein BB561_002748 [Smittium simulii]
MHNNHLQSEYNNLTQRQISIKLGQFSHANNDFTQAARIIQSNPSLKTEENTEVLKNAFQSISLGQNSTITTEVPDLDSEKLNQSNQKYSPTTTKSYKIDSKTFNSTLTELIHRLLSLLDDDYLNKIVQMSFFDSSSQNSLNALVYDDSFSLIQTIKYKLSQKQNLQDTHFTSIILLVVKTLNLEQVTIKKSAESTNIALDSSSKKTNNTNNSIYQNFVCALLEILEIDMKVSLEKSNSFLSILTEVWNKSIAINDEMAFCKLLQAEKTSLIYYKISKIYSDSIFIVLKNSKSFSGTVRTASAIFFSYLFCYGTRFLDEDKKIQIIQSAIKILSLENFNYYDIFVDEKYLSPIISFEHQSISFNKSSQAPRYLLELYHLTTCNNEEVSAFSNVLLTLTLEAFEDKSANSADKKPNVNFEFLVKYSTRIVSTWLQTGKQIDKAKGYKALCNIFLSQNSKLGSNILSEALTIESLFDEYENDSMQTNLALLCLVDAIVNKSEYRNLVEEFSYDFLLYSISINKYSNKIKDYDENLASQISIIGTKILCKLAVSEAPQMQGAANKDSNSIPQNKNIIEQDLLDTYSLILEKKIDDNADMISHIAEGLGYLSLKSKLKNQISASKVIIPELLSFIKSAAEKYKVNKNKILSIQFALVSIVNNLVYRSPILSEDEEAVEKLRNAAVKKGNTEQDKKEQSLLKELESAKFIDLRCASLSKIHGLLEFLALCSQSKNNPSDNIKDSIISIFFSFACVLEIRGLLVQYGCVRSIVESASVFVDNSKTYPPKEYTDKRDFQAAHTLAKLSISLPPLIAFPANGQVRINSLICPFLKLCSYSGNDMLCVFEALMALTNFASLPFDDNTPEEETPGYFIVNKYNGLDIIEMLVLNDMCMIRRAATELICNLSATVEAAFLYFIDGAEKIPTIADMNDKAEIEKITKDTNAPFRSHKLHLLAALSDIGLESNLSLENSINNDSSFDPRTALAALGTLATLTREPRAAKFLICCHPRFLDILADLLCCKSINFMHRAIYITFNCLSHEFSQTSQNFSKNLKLKSTIVSLATSKPSTKALFSDFKPATDTNIAIQIKELAEKSAVYLK